MKRRACILFILSGLWLLAAATLPGCSDPETSSIKLDVSSSEIEKEVDKLGNPGSNPAIPQKSAGASSRATVKQ